MDSVLHILYNSYIVINSVCSIEDVKFSDKKYRVELISKEYQVALKKIDTLSYTKASVKRIVEYDCVDSEGHAWIFVYEKTLYGYKLTFRQEDHPSLEIIVSNQNICK